MELKELGFSDCGKNRCFEGAPLQPRHQMGKRGNWALAPEGMYFSTTCIPSAAKAENQIWLSTDGLNSVPFKARDIHGIWTGCEKGERLAAIHCGDSALSDGFGSGYCEPGGGVGVGAAR
jgi:hypothetical protein